MNKKSPTGFDCDAFFRDIPKNVYEAFKRTGYVVSYVHHAIDEAPVRNHEREHDFPAQLVLSPGSKGLDANGNLTEQRRQEIATQLHAEVHAIADRHVTQEEHRRAATHLRALANG